MGYRVAWLVRRGRTGAAQATFLRTVLTPQVPAPTRVPPTRFRPAWPTPPLQRLYHR